jgi:hypothetical protein
VDRDRDVALLAEPLGEADVVAVTVGEDERAHVRDRPAHRRELAGEVAVQAGHPGVHDGDLVRFLDEVRVDDAAVPDAVADGGDPHLEPSRRRRPRNLEGLVLAPSLAPTPEPG